MRSPFVSAWATMNLPPYGTRRSSHVMPSPERGAEMLEPVGEHVTRAAKAEPYVPGPAESLARHHENPGGIEQIQAEAFGVADSGQPRETADPSAGCAPGDQVFPLRHPCGQVAEVGAGPAEPWPDEQVGRAHRGSRDHFHKWRQEQGGAVAHRECLLQHL